ncbi:uncharacterized protein LOC132177408 isoform X2 [Corylus avellana]|uniref:uncharacterized protein LOC132177408 isoform X2 n=1 Tax=Corylus avellana TaxID=13451 RepID=UPI002869F6F6|nr:uncharacterized protein LOC132177408 isoform X2 [Corylus avellana]
MASTLTFRPNPNPCTNGVVSSPRRQLGSFAFESTTSLFRSKLLAGKSFSLSTGINRPEAVISASSRAFDVVIVGAGIIGLTIARQFLIGSDLSVAVVDKAVPCSGATGAGQGYIWKVHKTPGSDKWELAMRSHELWKMLADSIHDQGLNPLEVLGWKKTGSLLIGRTPGDSDLLKRRVQQLSEAGLQAEYLSGHDLLQEEPALMVGEDSSAAFLPDDCQLDAQRTVAFIEKGHLLVLENFNALQLNHGLMEAGYVNHQTISASGPLDHGQALSVSMTATMDAMGNLVLGSSRQFSGFNSEVDEPIITHIWKRAGEFFPTLKELPLSDFIKSRKVRVGLRPYMPDGRPVIGPVPGLSNVFLATGHEGEGLSLALGTAEMVADMVLGNPGKVDNAPFAVPGRC